MNDCVISRIDSQSFFGYKGELRGCPKLVWSDRLENKRKYAEYERVSKSLD